MRSMPFLSMLALLFIVAIPSVFAANYTLEGTAFYAYNKKIDHTGFNYENIAYYAYTQKTDENDEVYRFHNKINGDYLYTTSHTERDFIKNKLSYWWDDDGVVFYAHKTQKGSSVPVYRFYNKVSDQHLFTTSDNEKNFITTELSFWWKYEGISFYTYKTEEDSTSPVHRFYSKTKDSYFFTIDAEEYNNLLGEQKNALVPVYRFYNSIIDSHYYTINEKEKNNMLNDKNSPYKYEGENFYVFSQNKDDVVPVYYFYNKITGHHHYSISVEEKKLLEETQSNWWDYKGIAFYAHSSQLTGSFPVYRLFNGVNHLFTLNETEKNNAIATNTGPQISVGLWYYDKNSLQSDPFEIDANKPYNIKDKDGKILAQVGGDKRTKVTYDSDGYLKVSGSISSKKVKTAVTFDAADGNNADLIFDVHRSNSSYDHYRGKIAIRYYKGKDIIAGKSDTVTQIWVINTLPLEHYTWGMGETTGTGDIEHTKVMTAIFRTYGRWYIEYATKYAPLGFKIRSDAGSQIYRGYDWEKKYPNIKKAAEATRGVIAKYDKEIALTPYSSWSDGKTRSFKERWGSSDYPWCKSVKDPYGKHTSKSTTTLEKEGNHMVGLIANGSLELAGEHDWKYDKIMKYYYSGIKLDPLY